MKIHNEKLSDVQRFIRKSQSVTLDEKKREYNIRLEQIRKFKVIDDKTKILEIGSGTGWFQVLCKKEGLSCRGLEISPQLVKYAKQIGNDNGMDLDIELGNIEETDIGTSCYDIIIALAVFEHVEHWQAGLQKVFDALVPGGLFYFTSTNKFALRQTEFRFPFYSWMPDKLRFSLRKYLQGADIMKLGIDFNEFRPSQFRDYFNKIGYSVVLDWTQFLDANAFVNQNLIKKLIIRSLKKSNILRSVALTFSKLTYFICIK